MAIAYKCDRCGGFYTDYKYDEVSEVRLFGTEYQRVVCSYPPRHLCPVCAKSLDLWFKNPGQFAPGCYDTNCCGKKKRWWRK